MFFIVKTLVEQDYLTVAGNFGKDLFLSLNPPFPPVTLLRYDGNQPGNEVHLELNFLLFRQTWVSVIQTDFKDENEYFFIDEGTQLPFFLKYWHHKHRLIRQGTQTRIVDEVTFRSPFVLTDFLLFPVLYFQFLYRQPIYKKYFKR